MRTFILQKNNLTLAALLAIGSLMLVWQCKVPQPVLEEKGQANIENSLLWRIDGKNLEHPSYVFGTIHIIPSEHFFWPQGTLEAIDTAKTLFLEVDMTQLEDPVMQMELMQQSFMADDLTLRDLLSDEDYQVVKTHFEKMGLPLFFLERIKPLFLSVFADPSINPSSLNDGSVKIYEFELTKRAQGQDMVVLGLETLEFQLGIMDSIPYQDQADLLVESIRTQKDGSSQFDSLVSLYVNQDVQAMYGGFEADSLSLYDNLLLTNRNRNWIPVMEKYMQTGSCFFAVGAAHLGGPNGVITLLRDEGYRLRPVSVKVE